MRERTIIWIIIIDIRRVQTSQVITNEEMTENVKNQDFQKIGKDLMWVVKDSRIQVFQESQVHQVTVAAILSHTYHR